MIYSRSTVQWYQNKKNVFRNVEGISLEYSSIKEGMGLFDRILKPGLGHTWWHQVLMWVVQSSVLSFESHLPCLLCPMSLEIPIPILEDISLSDCNREVWNVTILFHYSGHMSWQLQDPLVNTPSLPTLILGNSCVYITCADSTSSRKKLGWGAI